MIRLTRDGKVAQREDGTTGFYARVPTNSKSVVDGQYFPTFYTFGLDGFADEASWLLTQC
jgi:hypothetical protein